jgi:predicted dehydrogenase
MDALKLGVIGSSPGNGHPYSWSAIFNGYDHAAMAACPFPAIPQYLAARRFPQDAIPGARVTHVWTQDRALSEHIAAAALIPTIIDDPTRMIGAVDALLLARDDAENHLALAMPFLQAGLPVYIDKPLALSRREALAIYACQSKPGLVFSCSALAYAREFQLLANERDALGRLRYVEAVTPKDWNRYAIHVIEPLMNLLTNEGDVTRAIASGERVRALDLEWASGLMGRIVALGSPSGPIEIRLYGENAVQIMTFRDSFEAFRTALHTFKDIVTGTLPPQAPERVLPLIDVVEAGSIA